MEAVFTLQVLVRSWLAQSFNPVFAVFIAVQRAFPSVDRVELVSLLNRQGLPFPMIRAIASTFAFTTSRLRMEGCLTETFPVNLGVREGDIESPPLFNLVYGEILWVAGLDVISNDVFVPRDKRVVGIAYADDFALMAQNICSAQTSLDNMSIAMLTFNLRMNRDKTKLLIFVQKRKPRGFLGDIRSWQICVEGQPIEMVCEFKYLGITLNFLCEPLTHPLSCESRAIAAAVQYGGLFRRLEITDFRKLRAFFLAFVQSQFHGSQIVSFSKESMEKALMLFLRSCFSLPIGYPRAIFCELLDIDEFFLTQIRSRWRFFSRNIRLGRINSALTQAFLHDRELFRLGIPCWSRDFCKIFESFYNERAFIELDLFEEESQITELLRMESMSQRTLRMTLSPSAHLLRDLLPHRVTRSFLVSLSQRSFEEVRLILLFWGNMLRYCFFTGSVEICLLCSLPFNSEHFLSCTEINNNGVLGNWRLFLENENWEGFISFFFLVALEWIHRTNPVRLGHQKVNEKANGISD